MVLSIQYYGHHFEWLAEKIFGKKTPNFVPIGMHVDILVSNDFVSHNTIVDSSPNATDHHNESHKTQIAFLAYSAYATPLLIY